MKTLLQGKTISAVFVSEGEGSLRFDCSDGTAILWSTEGDCCSESWFSDITGFAAIIGGQVASVEQLEDSDEDPNDGRSRQEVDKVYGYEVVTNKGRASIAFRNSSNGYYGGWMNELEDDRRDVKWRQISDDWSA